MKQAKTNVKNVVTRFVVKKPFKYGRKFYKQGQEFQPAGNKYDKLLIEHHCTTIHDIAGGA